MMSRATHTQYEAAKDTGAKTGEYGSQKIDETSESADEVSKKAYEEAVATKDKVGDTASGILFLTSYQFSNVLYVANLLVL
jgi:hypothetical protein